MLSERLVFTTGAEGELCHAPVEVCDDDSTGAERCGVLGGDACIGDTLASNASGDTSVNRVKSGVGGLVPLAKSMDCVRGESKGVLMLFVTHDGMRLGGVLGASVCDTGVCAPVRCVRVRGLNIHEGSPLRGLIGASSVFGVANMVGLGDCPPNNEANVAAMLGVPPKVGV